jgi:pimeloyl-ACP methyl ester carboxylesterase
MERFADGVPPPVMTTTRERDLAASVIATVLVVDGIVHLYWSTGLTWPAGNSRSLSLALLAIDVPFRPALLLGLAATVWAGAGLVVLRARHGRSGVLGRVAQAGTAIFTAAVLLRALLGCWWLFTWGSLPTTFYWLNLLLYTPLCVVLFVLGMRLLGAPRSAGRQHPLRRLLSARAAATTTPALLVVALLVSAFGYAPQVQSSYSPSEQLGTIQSRYVDTALARFHYVREGTGSAVVLLSPGSAWLQAWLPEVRALSATHTVYAVDLPGQGFTRLHDEHFRFDLAGMSQAIGTFLDAERLGSVALAGNSWSGGWALAFAQAQPRRVRSLVLLAPSGLAEPDPMSWELLKLPLVGRAVTHLAAGSKATMRAGLRDLFVHKSIVTPDVVDAMWAPNTFPDNLRADYELEQNLDWTQTQRALPTTRVPTLIIWGREDHVLPSSQAAGFGRLLPIAQVQVIQGCGHALTLDCAGPVSHMMESFWHDRRR